MTLPSCSTRKPKYNYDVFLSFRGKDTRNGFTSHLNRALCEKGINTFMDKEELQRGQQISPTILTAIEESKMSMIVFSENYASSPWCLDELVKIIECMQQRNQIVIPIFYNVEAATVRHQLKSYNEAMAKHKERYEMDRVQRWRTALSEASHLVGEVFSSSNEIQNESQFIQKIINDPNLKHLKHLHSKVDDKLVGLEFPTKEVNALLSTETNKDSLMVGIYGCGGIGKTTLARVLYDLIVDEFERSCILDNVRDVFNRKGLLILQQKLLDKILCETYVKLSSIHEGKYEIKKRLQSKRVLLVLDDVDKLEQLEGLVGKRDWFGTGSRIIITSRNKQLLVAHQVEKTYQMKELNDFYALELFNLYAFKEGQLQPSYLKISKSIVHYAKGLPLALKVIGADLVSKSLKEWECALEKYKRILNQTIQEVLRVSYDSLDEHQKIIFLDIACFFRGERLEYVEKILKGCDFFPEINIGVLDEKCLLSTENGRLEMHDLIRDMGRAIVEQIAPGQPGKRSRLWFYKDVVDVLKQNTGTNNIEGIFLTLPRRELVQWDGTAFTNMEKLRILVIRNAIFSTPPVYLPNSLRLFEWKGYPSETLPSSFCPKNLVSFCIPHSYITSVKPFVEFQSLTRMNFSGCKFLTQVPDVSGVPNLQYLKLSDCSNLVEVHNSVGCLRMLVLLDASRCINLKRFPRGILMPSLECLSFNQCRSLEVFPNILGKMECIFEIDLSFTAIKEFRSSSDNRRNLPSFHPKILVDKLFKEFQSLTSVNFSGCKFLTQIPDVSGVPNLKKMDLTSCSNLVEVHDSVGFLSMLDTLDAHGCRNLKCFPRGILMPSLNRLSFGQCRSLEFFPNILGKMECLSWIDLTETAIKELPVSFDNLTGLRFLQMRSCKSLKNLPSTLFMKPLFRHLLMPDCPQLVKSVRQVDVNNSPILSELTMAYCGISKDDLQMIFNRFPMLQGLDIRGSNLESLPTCIKEAVHLGSLNVDDCKNLREIPEIPSSLWRIKANKCISLSSESSDRLWSQAFKVGKLLYVDMPATEIPDWFDHREKGEIMCFWIRQKFPTLTVAVVVKKLYNLEDGMSTKERYNFSIKMSINGVKVKTSVISYPILAGHVVLFDLKSFLMMGKRINLDAFLLDDWNSVEICYNNDPEVSRKLPVECSGAYFCKNVTNMEDIRFECPKNPFKTSSFLFSEHGTPKKLMKGAKDKGKGKLTNK